MGALTIGNLFDGIGGFPLAGKRAGMEAKWGADIDKFCEDVTRIRIPEMGKYGSVKSISGEDVQPVDIITGGSPCQDLSVAGKRAGMNGERSSLFFEQIRIVREMRAKHGNPRYMVWENVLGAFSSNKGEDFRSVIEEIVRVVEPGVTIPRPKNGKWEPAGCVMGDDWSVAWRVFDAQFWGVPQRRRRIYLVADFGGQSAPEVLFELKGLSGDIAKGANKREGTTREVEAGTGGSGAYCLQGNGIGCSIDAGCNGKGWAEDVSYTLNTVDVHVALSPLCFEPRSQDGVPRLYGEGPTPTLNTAQGGQRQPCVVQETFSMQRSDEYKSGNIGKTLSHRDYKSATDLGVNGLDCEGYTSASFGGYKQGAGTLRASGGDLAGGSEVLVASKASVRRLTPLECERLQGFPDNWTNIPGGSDSKRYKALGNSMAIPCVSFAMRRIAEENLTPSKHVIDILDGKKKNTDPQLF